MTGIDYPRKEITRILSNLYLNIKILILIQIEFI